MDDRQELNRNLAQMLKGGVINDGLLREVGCSDYSRKLMVGIIGDVLKQQGNIQQYVRQRETIRCA